MNNPKNTKRALLTSVLSLLLCLSMLIGTTFAWFTDEVKSASNIITAGNLDVEVVNKDGDSIESVKLFDGILWEPGVVAYENITIQNLGTLGLEYALNVNFINENFVVEANGNKTPYGLSTVLKVAIVDKVNESDRDVLVNSISADKWFYLQDLRVEGELLSKAEKTYGIVIWWEPSAFDNNWNVNNNKTTTDGKPLHIDLGINVLATQLVHENDSFGNKYDENAVFEIGTSGSGIGVAGANIEIRNDQGTKIGAMEVTSNAMADPTKEVEVTYTATTYNGNFTVAAGMETLSYDIQVTNLKENNTIPVKVMIRLPAGLNPATVSAYHKDDKISGVTYNPETGYVTFDTTSFSPFTVIYDAESVYTPVVLPEGMPTASVVRSPEYENTELDWGKYGAWAPTEGLDSQLEAAYTFSCTESLEEAELNAYAYWYCDFVVVLDKALGESEIFLGGNYGSFGWVGFHNGDLTLAANTEIPLLGSVTNNPWTYLDVVQNVGTFICGVGDVDDALSGATFTVMLRLTNPENENEFYNVATITYTFE